MNRASLLVAAAFALLSVVLDAGGWLLARVSDALLLSGAGMLVWTVVGRQRAELKRLRGRLAERDVENARGPW